MPKFLAAIFVSLSVFIHSLLGLPASPSSPSTPTTTNNTPSSSMTVPTPSVSATITNVFSPSPIPPSPTQDRLFSALLELNRIFCETQKRTGSTPSGQAADAVYNQIFTKYNTNMQELLDYNQKLIANRNSEAYKIIMQAAYACD